MYFQVVWGLVTDSNLAKQLNLIENNSDGFLKTEPAPTSSKRKRNGTGRPLPPFRLLIGDSIYVCNKKLPSWSEPRPILDWVLAQITGDFFIQSVVANCISASSEKVSSRFVNNTALNKY